jgi:predicted permease
VRAWFQDVRYAVRMLGKNPGLTAVMVLSLAIGIGANSAIFSVVDGLLLRPLPYPQPQRLAAIWLHSPGIGIAQDWPSPGQYNDILKENHSFEEVSMSRLTNWTLTGFGEPRRVNGMRTTSNLMRLLGAKAIYGRVLLPEDDQGGKQPVAVLSYGLWTRFFNSDPNIVGKSITLSAQPYTVAGVLSRDFRLNTEVMPSEGPADTMDVFLPLPLTPAFLSRRGDENYNLLAKLKAGVTVQQAQADIDVIASRIREKDKRDRTYGMHVIGLLDQVVGDVRRVLLVLLGSVGLVLLSACANVANLLLTRAAGREKEVAIRTALGAGWQRVARQLLTESVLLSLLGGAGGLVLAMASLWTVRTMNPGNIPRLEDIGINVGVMAFTFGVSLLTGILFGLAPVWRAVRLDLNTSLKAGGRSGQSDSGMRLTRHRLRGLLVVSEVALSLMLLIGAGLLIRSFVRLQSVPPGFNPDHVLSLKVAFGGPKYRDEKVTVRTFQDLYERVAHLPGVRSQGAVSPLPLTGEVSWGGVSVEGFTPEPGQELQADQRIATENYFTTMEIPLREGRFFTPHDTADSPPVAIIDERFARRFWPNQPAVGKHIWFDPKKPITIVGVVGSVKQYALGDEEGKPVLYGPHTQQPGTGVFLVARTSSDPASLSAAITREVHAVDPTAVVDQISTMQERVHDALARQRFATLMLGAFAVFGLILAAVGVYGVISYLVTQSTHDIGVRVALGAQRSNIVWMVARQGLELTGLGIGAGLIGAAVLTRVMSSLLFGVSATDALTFSAVAVLLAVCAMLATYIPAHRATRVDPMIALREE